MLDVYVVGGKTGRDVMSWTSGKDKRNEDEYVELKSLGEKLWWPKFAGADLLEVDEYCLKSRVCAANLCYALGAGEDEDVRRYRMKEGMIVEMRTPDEFICL